MKKLIVLALLVVIGCNASPLLKAGLTEGNVNNVYLKASYHESRGEYEDAINLIDLILPVDDTGFLYNKMASLYVGSNKFDDAAIILEKGIKKFPKNDKLLFFLARIYKSAPDKRKQAEEMFRRAIDVNPEEGYVKSFAGMFVAENKYDEAIALYSDLIKKYPKVGQFYSDRGRLHLIVKDSNKAEVDFKKAVEIDGDLASIARLADIYIKNKEYDKAIKYLDIMSEKRPGDGEIEIRLAELYKKIGQNEKAIHFYLKSSESVDKREKLYALREAATLYFQNKDFEQALKLFLQIKQESPETLSSYYSIGVLYELKEETEKAKENYLEALKIRDDYTEIRKRLAYIYLKEKKYDTGIAVLEKVPEDDRDARFYRIYSGFYTERDMWQMAQDILEEGKEKYPANEDIIIGLASMMEKMDKFDDLEKVLKDGLEKLPDSAAIMNFLGYMYADKNIKLEEAKTLIEKALKQKPDSSAYLDSMAWVLFRMGKVKEAYDFQVQALRISPKEEEIREHMRVILKALKIKKSLKQIINGK